MAKLSLYFLTLMLGSNFSASAPPAPGGEVVSKQAGLVSHVAALGPAVEFSREFPAAGKAAWTEHEQRSANLVNAERKARGLNALSVNPLLVQVAREHSREMWEKGYFDHYSPTAGARTPMQRYLKDLGRRPTWAFLGENLFYCSIVDAERGHRCLMRSLKHRDNILNEQFREIGVGCFTAPDGQFYVTQLFLAQTG